jgi:hypothetical protein
MSQVAAGGDSFASLLQRSQRCLLDSAKFRPFPPWGGQVLQLLDSQINGVAQLLGCHNRITWPRLKANGEPTRVWACDLDRLDVLEQWAKRGECLPLAFIQGKSSAGNGPVLGSEFIAVAPPGEFLQPVVRLTIGRVELRKAAEDGRFPSFVLANEDRQVTTRYPASITDLLVVLDSERFQSHVPLRLLRLSVSTFIIGQLFWLSDKR